MKEKTGYVMNMKDKFGHLKLIDIPKLATECKEKWFNQTLCHINDCVARLGVVQGEFHWHKHDQEDEFFLVLEGKLYIDLEGKTIELNPHQGFTVPKGVIHRTRAEIKTVMLMIEKSSVKPTGD
ncbi:MAG: cupin domain-containing protein [Planctomycetes bacterium]|nr:cupin domain-containing protein [Planctomycetota bacterium]